MQNSLSTCPPPLTPPCVLDRAPPAHGTVGYRHDLQRAAMPNTDVADTQRHQRSRPLPAGVWVRPAHGDGSAERAQSSEVAEVRGRFFLVSTALSGRAPSLRLRSALD